MSTGRRERRGEMSRIGVVLVVGNSRVCLAVYRIRRYMVEDWVCYLKYEGYAPLTVSAQQTEPHSSSDRLGFLTNRFTPNNLKTFPVPVLSVKPYLYLGTCLGLYSVLYPSTTRSGAFSNTERMVRPARHCSPRQKKRDQPPLLQCSTEMTRRQAVKDHGRSRSIDAA